MIKPVVEEGTKGTTIKKLKELVEEFIIKKHSESKKQVVSNEITMKIKVPEEHEEVSELKNKPKKPIVQETAEEITIKCEIEQKSEVEKVTEEVTVEMIKPKNNLVEEEVAKEVQKPEPEHAAASEDISIKKAADEGTIKKLVQIEDEIQEFTIKKKVPSFKPVHVEEIPQEVTIKKPVKKHPKIREYTKVENVTFRPKSIKTKEVVEQEFKIFMNMYAEEEISMWSKVKLKKQHPLTYSEEIGRETIIIRKEIEEEEGPVIEEIIDAEELPYDDDFEAYNVPLKHSVKPRYSIQEEDEISIDLSLSNKRPQDIDFEEESLTHRLRRKILQPSFNEGAAFLSITKNQCEEEEEDVDGDISYSCFIAKAEQAVDLVKDEKPIFEEIIDNAGDAEELPYDKDDFEAYEFPSKPRVKSHYSIQEEDSSFIAKAEQAVDLVKDEKPIIEEIIDDGSDAEELPYDKDDFEAYEFPLKRRVKPHYSIQTEDEISIDLSLSNRQPQAINFEEESLTHRLIRKISQPSFNEGEASLSITKDDYEEKEEDVVEVVEGDMLCSSFIAEAEQAVDLIQSEKPIIEEIIDDGSDAEELPYDKDDFEAYEFPLKRRVKPHYSIQTEDEISIDLSLSNRQPQAIDFKEESLTHRLRRKISQPSFNEGEASLSITKNDYEEKEENVVEIVEGDMLCSSFIAEAEQAVDLVKSEKPIIEEIIDDGSDAEELPYDKDDFEAYEFPLMRWVKPHYSIQKEDEISIDLSLSNRQPQAIDFEEESLTHRLKRKKSQPSFNEGEASLSITKNQYEEEEEDVDGDISYSSFIAKAEQTVDLVKDEKTIFDEIIDDGSDAEELPYDKDDFEAYQFPLKRGVKSHYSIQEEGEISIDLSLTNGQPEAIDYEEESLTHRLIRKISQPSFDEGEVSLSIIKKQYEEEEAVEVVDSKMLYSITSFIDKSEKTVDLVTDERPIIEEIVDDSSDAEEEDFEAYNVPLKGRVKPHYSIQVINFAKDEKPIIEEIIDDGSDTEELPYDDNDFEAYNDPIKCRVKPQYLIQEDEISIDLSLSNRRPQAIDYEEESLRRKISQPAFNEGEIALSIIKKQYEEEKVEEVVAGQILYPITSFIAKAEQTVDLIKDERPEKIIDEDSDAEELLYDSNDFEAYNDPLKRRVKPHYSIQEEDEISIYLSLSNRRSQAIDYKKESHKLRRKVSQPSFDKGEASISITKDRKKQQKNDDEDIVEVVEGDMLYSNTSYIAEAEQPTYLLKDERAFVIETDNGDL